MRDHDEPQPVEGIPPSAVRSALTWMIPFAVIWAIGGMITWTSVLSGFGATWPAFLHTDGVAGVVVLINALFGAACGLVLRLLLWVSAERRRKQPVPRRPRVKRDIKTVQDWQEL